jgi:hypothetical protein
MIAEKAYDRVEASDSAGVEQEEAPRNVPVEWGLAKRILFRFVCSYFFLYIFPFPLDYIPYVDLAAQKYSVLWSLFVPWVGKHLFGLEITVFPNGSGDTTFNYVQVFCFAVLAAVATLVWSLLDRKRANYARLHEWLRIYVRFFLAASMVSYGAYKVFPSQFPAPSLDRLIQPIGDASPMGILWTFIGASQAYEFFSGAAEMLGGLLLLGRRTTLLGALVSIGVVGNVVMLNFSYDVPVKLYSSHLFLMAVFLIAPDVRRLANFFLFNRAAAPAEVRPLFRRVWLNRAALACRTLLLLGIAGLALSQSYQGIVDYAPSRSPFYGIWNVEELEIDGQARPALLADESRWARVIFDFPGLLAVQLMNQSRERYGLNLDLQKKVLELTKRDDPKWKSVLSFKHAGPGLLALEGTFDGHKLRARLHRTENPKFRLVDRGFHWINEYPFNR